jgi:hypothetical protein
MSNHTCRCQDAGRQCYTENKAKTKRVYYQADGSSYELLLNEAGQWE